jgi:uncharacterized membrane protein
VHRERLLDTWDALRASYWFVPSIMALAAVAFSFLTLALDQAVQDEDIPALGWMYTGGPEGARALLSTAAGSMITVAGVVFSIAIVVMTLASVQFGPRLLRNFMRDTGNQLVLGTFIADFLYCLLVLRAVRDAAEGTYVPHISVTVGVSLTLASIGVLIYFIHHAAASIQIGNILFAAGRALDASIDHLYPSLVGHEPPKGSGDPAALVPARFEKDSQPIEARHTGYVDAVDSEGLLDEAVRRDLLLRLEIRPGSFLEPGVVICRAWPAQRVDPRTAQRIERAILVDRQRTERQDVEFAIQQLVQVAVRALSPAINDPWTAFMCLDRLGASLSRLAGRPLPSTYRFDDRGRLRIIADASSFEKMASQAFTEIRRYGAASLTVTVRLLETITVVAEHASRPDDLAALRRHAERIERGCQATFDDPSELKVVEDRYRAALEAINAAESATRRNGPDAPRAMEPPGGAEPR